MLKISSDQVKASGGFLAALAEESAAFAAQLIESRPSTDNADRPAKIIVHKEPHLDEYFAAFFFRCTQSSEDRSIPFVERGLHWDVDRTAEAEWPYSAVFGFGAGRAVSDSALYHFDEHLPEGGRKEDSCTDIVFNECLANWAECVDVIRDEVSAIDTSGGAHSLHLHNLLKSVHLTQFFHGHSHAGKPLSGKIVAHWKRAIVEALLTSILYCDINGIDYTSKKQSVPYIEYILSELSEAEPFVGNPALKRQLEDLSGKLNPGYFKSNVKISINGKEKPQLLVLPSLIAASYHAWGPEICQFLISHLVEAQARSNSVYNKTLDLARKCWSEEKFPKEAAEGTLSLRMVTCFETRALGVQRANHWDKNYNKRFRPKPILISIIHCRYTDATPQPHKGLQRFLSEDLHGVGLLLLEHVKEGRKAIFKGNAIKKEQWLAIVRRLQLEEPQLWYLVNENASFILNGNAAHPIPMSKLSARSLAKLIDGEVGGLV